MQTNSITLKYLLAFAIIQVLLGICISESNEVMGNSKVILKYPEYSGLEEETFEIQVGRTLGDYVSIGESKLKSLFGINLDAGIVRVRVNEVDLDESEFAHGISEFIVAKNEDVVVEFILSENFGKDPERDQEGKEKTGKIVLLLSLVESSGEGTEKLLKSVSASAKFPMTIGDLRLELERQIDFKKFSLESVTVFKNPGFELLGILKGPDPNEVLEVESGDIIKVKMKEINKKLDDDGRDLGSSGEFPIMIVFSNRRDIFNSMLRLKYDSTIGELIKKLHEISYPGTGAHVISLEDQFSIQNEQGREVIQDSEASLSEYIPEGLEISENRPLVLYVTVFGRQETIEKNDGVNSREEMSEIFEQNTEDMNEFMKNINTEIDRIEGEIGDIQKSRNADILWIEFADKERNLTFRTKNDPVITTFASVYSQAQLFWSTIKGGREKNCLLAYEGSEEEYLNPNDHDTLTNLSKVFGKELKLLMREPKKIMLEIQAYRSRPKGKNEENQEVELIRKLKLEIPEIISVSDFIRRLNSRYNSELSKYLIVGIQKKQDEGRVVEYLPVPRTPSSITYLTFFTENDSSLFLEVVPAKNVEIMMMIPEDFGGEEISKLSESSNSNEDTLTEYRLRILSNMSVRELVDSLIQGKVLKGVSPKSVFIKDHITKEYLNREYILGHHATEAVEEGKKMKNKMIFELEVLKMMNLEVSFHYPQGEEYSIEPFQITVKPGKKIKKIKEQIAFHLSNLGITFSQDQFGIGSGFDIGGEFRKVVYSIVGENEKIDDCGFVPNEILRVYLLKGDIEKDEENGVQKKIGSSKAAEGPELEIPLSLENCPLNTMLERRWFIIPMSLDTSLKDLKDKIDEVAMLEGAEFDLFGETEKGKVELNQDTESFLSLGVSDLGHLTAVCNGKKRKVEKSKSGSQPEIPQICENPDSGKCNQQVGKQRESPATSGGEPNVLLEYDSIDESYSEEVTSNQEQNKESLELLKKIEDKIAQLEEKELKLKRNRKMIEKLLKKEDAGSSKLELREKDLAKLIREFLTTYISKGTSGLKSFCRKQGSEKIEQLVVYISTPEGKEMARKIAKRIVDKEKRAKKKRRLPEDYNLVTEIEYTVLPRMALYSDEDSDSSVFIESSNSDNPLSEEEWGPYHEEMVDRPRSKKRESKKSSGTGRKRGSANRSLNGDLEPITKIQKKNKKGSRLNRVFKRIPVVSPLISAIYSRLSTKGRKKRRALKYIREILELEIQFRKKAYEGFQAQETPKSKNSLEEE
ncbi:hypothetical protein HWI79_3489 [Cryptosporidium felis]|nr:hypothetical protein HWI79_3489 [Cryptosporidium felis]